MKPLSLSEAISSNRLSEFIAQEEARGVAPVLEVAFDATASTVIKTPLRDDQTSGALHRDGSPEK